MTSLAGDVAVLAESLKTLAARVTACEDAETELAQDVSAHAGRLLALETPKASEEDWNFGPDALRRTLDKFTAENVSGEYRAIVAAKRDAVDALIAEMDRRVGALQWDQPGPDTDERRGFREGAGWALNVARELRP